MTKRSIFYSAYVLIVALMIGIYPVDISAMNVIQQANQMLKDGQSLSALNQFSTIIYNYPEKKYLYQRIGEAAYLAGEKELAKHYLEMAKDSKDLDGAGLMILGDIYQQSGNWKEAIIVWKKIELDQRNVNDVSNRLLNVFVSQSMWSDAERVLTSQPGKFPGDIELSERLGWIELFINPGKARKIFNDLSPVKDISYLNVINLIDKYSTKKGDALKEGNWWLEVGDLAVKYDQTDIALKAYEKSTEVDGKFAVGWMKIVLLKQTLQMDVETEIELAEKFRENDSLANAMLAEYWYIEKKPELSVIYLHKALEIDPKSQYSSLRLSQILSEIGNINEGLKYIKLSAVKLNSANSWKGVIIYCLENGIYIKDEALPAMRKAISLEPDSPEILDLAGQVFIALKDDVTAERYFMQAITKDKSFYLAQLHIGSLYARIGSIEGARSHLTIAAQQNEDLTIRDQANKILSTIQSE